MLLAQKSEQLQIKYIIKQQGSKTKAILSKKLIQRVSELSFLCIVVYFDELQNQRELVSIWMFPFWFLESETSKQTFIF